MADRDGIQCHFDFGALGRAQVHVLDHEGFAEGMGHGSFDGRQDGSPVGFSLQADAEQRRAQAFPRGQAGKEALSLCVARSMKMASASAISTAASRKGAPGR